jgi:DNA-directed RNA polymerase subunit M/transcription elongation factor TFIIS
MTETREVQGKAHASSKGILGSKGENILSQAPIKGPHELQTNLSLKCPDCGSRELRKSGLASRADGSKVQRLRCLDCNYRFRPDRAKEIKSLNAIAEDRQVCVPLVRGTKNLILQQWKTDPLRE